MSKSAFDENADFVLQIANDVLNIQNTILSQEGEQEVSGSCVANEQFQSYYSMDNVVENNQLPQPDQHANYCSTNQGHIPEVSYSLSPSDQDQSNTQNSIQQESSFSDYQPLNQHSALQEEKPCQTDSLQNDQKCCQTEYEEYEISADFSSDMFQEQGNNQEANDTKTQERIQRNIEVISNAEQSIFQSQGNRNKPLAPVQGQQISQHNRFVDLPQCQTSQSIRNGVPNSQSTSPVAVLQMERNSQPGYLAIPATQIPRKWQQKSLQSAERSYLQYQDIQQQDERNSSALDQINDQLGHINPLYQQLEQNRTRLNCLSSLAEQVAFSGYQVHHNPLQSEEFQCPNGQPRQRHVPDLNGNDVGPIPHYIIDQQQPPYFSPDNARFDSSNWPDERSPPPQKQYNSQQHRMAVSELMTSRPYSEIQRHIDEYDIDIRSDYGRTRKNIYM